METVEKNIANHKNDMFKRLNEQKELNAAVKSAKLVTADELAFGSK
jgi:hypothetical protein